MNNFMKVIRNEEKRLGVKEELKKENKIYLIVRLDDEDNECQFPLFGKFLKEEADSFNATTGYIPAKTLVDKMLSFKDAEEVESYNFLNPLIDFLEFAALCFLDEDAERIYGDEVSILVTDQEDTFNFSIFLTALNGYRTGVNIINWKEKGIFRFSNEERE